MVDTPNPRDIAPICEAIAAPVVAARGPAPLQARGGRARLLKTESGRVVTHGEVVAGLLARAEIEVAVVDGKRPEWIACEVCRVPVKVTHANGNLRRKCKACKEEAYYTNCNECGNRVKKKHGKDKQVCKSCSMRIRIRENPAILAKVNDAAKASMTHAQRVEHGRISSAKITDDQRRENGRRGAAITNEKRRAKKAAASVQP